MFTIFRYLLSIALGISLLAGAFYLYENQEKMQQIEIIFLTVRESPAAFVVVIAVFSLGALLIFPLAALLLATAYIFDPISGFFYALAGIIASTSISYGIGKYLGSTYLEKLNKRILGRIPIDSQDNSILWIAIIRNIPIAPFSLMNMIFGCLGLTLKRVLIGTILGISPRVALLMYITTRIEEAINQRDVILMLPSVCITLFFLLLGIFFEKRKRRMLQINSK